MITSEQEQITGWIHGRLPDDWFVEPAEVTVDRDEITIVGRIAVPEGADALVRRVLDDTLAFQQGTPRDDIALVALRVPSP